jgi:hypothetical protein
VTRNASVMIRPVMKDMALNGFGTSGGQVKPDGTFQATVAVGEYEIEGRARIGADGAPGQEEFGSVRVNVAADVSGVSIQLGLGATVSGRVSFDGTAPVPPPPGMNGPGRVVFFSPEGMACRSGSSEVAPDWTFTVKGVIGTCTAQLGGGLGRWFVKSITQDGNDLMDEPITFTSGQQMHGVEVVMTDKRAELTFHVTDEQGTPTRDYVGLLFPADKS